MKQLKRVLFLGSLLLISWFGARAQGTFWESTSFPSQDIYFLSRPIGGNIYAVGHWGLFKSTNQGIDWVELNRPFDEILFALVGTSDGILYANASGTIYRSTDGGMAWTPQKRSYGVFYMAVTPRGSVYSTSLSGSYFHKRPHSRLFLRKYIPPKAQHIASAAPRIAATDDGMIFVTVGPGQIYASSDEGIKWHQIMQPEILNGSYWNVFAGRGSEVFAVEGPPRDVRLFRSTNRGNVWTQIFDVVQRGGFGPSVSSYSVVSDGAGRIALGVANEGVYLTSDFGHTWSKAADGYPTEESFPAPSVIFTEDGHVLTGTARGIFRSASQFASPISHAEPVLEAIVEPQSFALEQNYPNPFNPSTTIGFQLKRDAAVTITVYDALGREVASLAHAEQFTAGSNEVTFDGSGLASGLYNYRISAVDESANHVLFTDVRMMLLLK